MTKKTTFLGLMVLSIFLFLPLTALGTILIDGEQVGIWDDFEYGAWYYSNYNPVNTAVVNYCGELSNYGTITNATVNDWGSVRNYGTITNATVNGTGAYGWQGLDTGGLYNYSDGTIYDTTLRGGSVVNEGQIVNMEYVRGNFTDHGGTIGTLTLAGNSTGIHWGIIDNLVFSKNSKGVISLPAVTGSFGFGEIKATNVDLTDGGITLDLWQAFVDFGSEENMLSSLFADGFVVASLFGTAEITGMDELQSFQLWLPGSSWFYVLENGELAKGWDFSNGIITWDGTAVDWRSYEVPEPATLLMLGLAAAGLPVVRRLRRK